MPQVTIDQAIRIAQEHNRAGRRAEAEALARQILAAQPNHPDALHLLGLIAGQAGRNDLATSLIRQAIAAAPGKPAYHCNLGIFLQKQGQIDQGIVSYQQAIALRPNYPEAHNNLGNAWNEKGLIDQAIASYKQALVFKPNYPEALNNLGVVFADEGRIDQAIDCYRQALSLDPNFPSAHYNLGNALKDTGQIDLAIACHRQALVLQPESVGVHSNLLLTLLYHPGTDPHDLLVESQRWDQQHAEPLKRFILPHIKARDPNRPLRIGYVSPDFRDHPVGRYMLRLLAARDRRAFRVFGYARVPRPDGLTAELQAQADHWRSVVGLSDQEAAEVIRQDQIDILVDLAGHTAGDQLLIFAHKPAPVQINYMGYPATTGLSAMDYRFTDELADPPGLTDRFHSEKLIRLPKCAWCCPRFENATAFANLPALETGRVTFGSFNNFAKVNEPLLSLWAKILNSTPGARLLLKAKGLNSESVQQRVRLAMGQAEIDPDRLELCPWVSPAEHLMRYGQVDIALDTYPYHGTTTTCESLWMGVPVVTLAGQSHVSRVGVSLLTNAGLPELIAQTPEQYVKIAADLAGDLPRLAEIRRTLRQRMQDSPLMDATRFARNIEAAYRQLWINWCAQSPPDPLSTPRR